MGIFDEIKVNQNQKTSYVRLDKNQLIKDLLDAMGKAPGTEGLIELIRLLMTQNFELARERMGILAERTGTLMEYKRERTDAYRTAQRPRSFLNFKPYLEIEEVSADKAFVEMQRMNNEIGFIEGDIAVFINTNGLLLQYLLKLLEKTLKQGDSGKEAGILEIIRLINGGNTE
jgi:hypothetical protein